MAKGIEINGQMRGKRGGVVYYRAAGQQISRARNFAPSNPKTAKQAVQRMVLATASKVTAALRPIVNHSFEGVRAGDDSVRHFLSRSMSYLRSVAAVYLGGSTAVDQPANFAIKGAPIAGGVGGLVVSSGRLVAPQYSVADGILRVSLSSPVSFGDADGYLNYLALWGMVPGDQLTIVLYQALQGSSAASFGDDFNPVDRYRYARVVFRPAAEIDFSERVPLFDGGQFNEALIERAEGVFPASSSSAVAGVTEFDLTEYGSWDALAAAVIISHRNEDGSFSYSTSRFEADRTYFDANNAFPVYESYMNTNTPIEVGDIRYLQHAVAAPFLEAGA